MDLTPRPRRYDAPPRRAQEVTRYPGGKGAGFLKLIRFDQTRVGNERNLPKLGRSCFLLEVVMERFVRQQNLLRFRDLLLRVSDQEQRQTIHRLIVEEKAKAPKLGPPAE
jgi:hypothetical protein